MEIARTPAIMAVDLEGYNLRMRRRENSARYWKTKSPPEGCLDRVSGNAKKGLAVKHLEIEDGDHGLDNMPERCAQEVINWLKEIRVLSWHWEGEQA
jgi:hypothetical protein